LSAVTLETIYYFPFDYDPGWTTEGDWAFGAPQGLEGDPGDAYSGDNVYGYNLNGAYPDDMPAYSLTTPPLNCAGFKYVTLSFWRWLGVESSSYDHAMVQVSTNGTDWTTVWENDTTTLQDSSWVLAQYDISAVADGQPTVYLRWVMGPSDFIFSYSGWNIDDVEVSGLPATEMLAWVPWADTGWEWPNTLSALDSAYGDYNLTETTTLDPATLADELVGKHVFLVPEQEGATGTDLQTAGEAFSDELRSFAERGGTVIVTGEYAAWSGFLSATGLLDATYQTVYSSGQALPVLDPAHPLAQGLGATVTGVDATSAYSITFPGTAIVVGDGSGNAVVAAQRIGAGAVVVMGFDYWSWDASAAQLLANAVRYPRLSTEVLLYDNNDPVLHVGKEALNRLNLPFATCNDDTLDTELGGQSWNAVVLDCPNYKPSFGWDGLISYINSGGHSLLSTWGLAAETDLCAAFDATAVEDVGAPATIYDWDVGPPFFDFTQSVPSPLAGWQDVYWLSNRTRLEPAEDGLAVAGFAAAPTADETAIVFGSDFRTILDGFLWDDRDQDADSDGLQDVVELVMNQVQLLVAVPVPEFEGSVTDGVFPLTVEFTDLTHGSVTGWEWDFGDGGTSAEQNPTHEYLAEGLYTVTLIASNANGSGMSRKVDYISVATPPPGANFTAAPLEGVVPLTVSFTDTSTGGPTSWSWNFGDGGTSTAQDPSHEYTEPGKYTVSLTATGPSGYDTETKTKYIKAGFPDTPPDDFWAFDEVLDCVDADVVAGYEDGLYHPDIQIDRALMATYTARALAGGDGSVPPGPGTATFPDVDTGFWAFKYVEYAVSQDVVEGYGDGLYHHEILLDRGQMAVFIARSVAGDDASVPDGPPTPTFPDVDTGFWSYRHVEYCKDQGIVGGYEDGMYHPEYPVTRDQMAVYVARALPLL
jgi:PKD repeat protein